MREQELRKLIIEEFLAQVEDPRVERTRKHSLENILVISLLAVICGADSFVAIANFARHKRDWLATFLEFEDLPSHDTIGRVFAALDPRELSAAFARWTTALRASSQEKLIAIDGKTLRGSIRQAGQHAFVHMVSAWSSTNRVVLGQVKTDEKSNEISAIPKLLELLAVKGAIITIDSAGTQVEIAELITAKGGDYLLAVKGNQPSLHESIVRYFTGRGAVGRPMSFLELREDKKKHGRLETRRAWVSTDIDGVQTDAGHRWPGLALIARVEAIRTVGTKTTSEDRYFISSKKLSPQELLDAVRSHWGIENELHWCLDVAFREDDCRVRAVNAAANFSAIRHLALSLLKQRTEVKSGIKTRRLVAGWDHDYLLRVIGAKG